MSPSPWRFFPLAVIAALCVVAVVNGGMVYTALHSFPGKAGDEGFALSNHYDAIIEEARREASFGWAISAWADRAGSPVLSMTDSSGAPLRGVSVTASAERPLGAAEPHSIVFIETNAGHYVANARLPAPGQWELTLSASRDGHSVAVTRRVMVH